MIIKPPMTIREKITLSFILFLAFGMFVECAMSGVCFCGRCCPKVIQDQAGLKPDSTFHKASFSRTCNNCRLIHVNSFKAIHLCKQNLNVKIFHSLGSSGFSEFISSGMSARYAAFEKIGGFKSSPIYLQYLCFRC